MVKFALALFFSLTVAFAETTYHIKWTTKLPLDAKTARGPDLLRFRVSEKGIFKKGVDLPILSAMPEGKVTLKPGERAFIYALIKNIGKRTIKFSVAPHSTNPGSSALGFNFNCLCNGHVYEVKPGEIWYKIMLLNTNNLPKGKDVSLVHNIFEVSKNVQVGQDRHPGHDHH